MRGKQSERDEKVRGEDARTAGGDKERQRATDIGRRAGTSGRYQGSSGRSREEEDLTDLSSQTDADVNQGLDDLRKEELSGFDPESIESVGDSDTDEDENEGLGDGRIGRSVRGDLK